MNKFNVYALFGAALFITASVNATPVLHTSDFIADVTRSNFNGFEAIPNDGTLYTGGSGPYVEDGIRVEQINGDIGNDIWVNCGCGTYEGNHSWYPNGGGTGYTQITLADGSEFVNFGFYAGTGASITDLIYYDLLLNGVSVLNGSVAAFPNGSGSFSYIGFSGGGFDTINIRDNWQDGSGVYGQHTALALDALETSGSPIPEPGVLALMGLGLAGIAFARKKSQI